MSHKSTPPRKFLYPLISFVLSLTLSHAVVSAEAVEPKIGSVCKKAGLKAQTATKVSMICTKSGKKLIWKKVSVRPIPSPTPTASPSPTPTASPSPTPTASPSPTPSPTTVKTNISAECIELFIRGGKSRESSSAEFAPADLNLYALCTADSGVKAVITSLPFKTTEMLNMTKFRSCSGHDFAEGSADGQAMSNDSSFEKFSSMKHYLSPRKQNAGDKTSVYIPFDGVITRISSEDKFPGGGGFQVDIVSQSNASITLTFMHIFDISVKVGDLVRAGDQFATHEVLAANVGHSSYDIVISIADMNAMMAKARRLGSFINYLNQATAAQLAGVGITPENSIWSSQYRQSNPCIMTGNQGFFQGPESSLDRVSFN